MEWEIEQDLEGTKAELNRWRAASKSPNNGAKMAQRERDTRSLKDRELLSRRNVPGALSPREQLAVR